MTQEAVSSILKENPNAVLVKDLAEINNVYKDFISITSKADQLIEVIDPEATPYKSKYEARDLLEQLARTIEGSRTIAFVENKQEIVTESDWRLASIRIRLATIGWDCEEPHTTQIELDLAANYYYPTLHDYIMTHTQDDADKLNNKNPSDTTNITTTTIAATMIDDIESCTPSLPSYFGSPVIHTDIVIIDVMKCLNLSGILWAGRGRLKRSFIYFHLCHRLYQSIDKSLVLSNTNISSSASSSSSSSSSLVNIHIQSSISQSDNMTSNHTLPNNDISQENNTLKIQIKDINIQNELESIYTHTLFYLAQSYGHLQKLDKSSEYCKLTLQRQLLYNFITDDILFDWVKNCLGLSDYYMTIERYTDCICTILSAEKVFITRILPLLSTTYTSTSTTTSNNNSNSIYANYDQNTLQLAINELHGDINKKFIVYYCKILRLAMEIELKKINEPTKWTPKTITTTTTTADVSSSSNSNQDKEDITIATSTATATTASEVHVPSLRAGQNYEYFTTLSIIIPSYINYKDIKLFEDARCVFLRVSRYLEITKKIYPLDGYVTDHVNLLYQHSKCYHYLSIFETDKKRKLAMQNRRVELLLPLMTSLSRSAYEGLHKQLAYELGETYIALHEIKSDIIQDKSTTTTTTSIATQTSSSSGGLTPKRSEVLKLNEYCRMGLAMFTHFTSFFQKSDLNSQSNKSTIFKANMSSISCKYINMSLNEIMDDACWVPDESLLSEDELRPFFNCHFLSARLLSKLIYIHTPSNSIISTSSSFSSDTINSNNNVQDTASKMNELTINPIVTSTATSSSSTTSTAMSTLNSSSSNVPSIQSLDKTIYLRASLKRYEWLLNQAPKVCKQKQTAYEDIFYIESLVCKDMVDLLPSKIDRVHYLGENTTI